MRKMRLATLFILSVLLLSFFAAELRASEPGVAIFSDVHVPKGEVRHEDVVCIGGKAVIDGKVEGDVVVVAGRLEFSGEANQVVTVLSPAVFKSGATVHGEMVHVLGEMEKSATAAFEGEQVDVGSRLPRGVQKLLAGGLIGLFVLFRLVEIAVSGILILLVVLLIPDRVERISEGLDSRWPSSLGFGLLAWVGVAVLFVGLAVTIIGIPIAILVLVGSLILGLVGVTAILLPLGRKVGTEIGLLSDASTHWANVLVGFATVSLVRFVPVVGDLVWLLVCVIGFGLALVTKLGSAEAEAGAS